MNLSSDHSQRLLLRQRDKYKVTMRALQEIDVEIIVSNFCPHSKIKVFSV